MCIALEVTVTKSVVIPAISIVHYTNASAQNGITAIEGM